MSDVWSSMRSKCSMFGINNIHLLDSAEPDIRFVVQIEADVGLSFAPTSASICTTNRMLGEALPNKCFIMPKSPNDNIKNWVYFGQILSCSDDKHFQVNYILNTHARWISNLLLCADWLIDSPKKIFFGFEILWLARTEKKFLPWVYIILASGSLVLVTKRFVELTESLWRNIHTLLQLEVSNYHNKLQPGSQCHVCTDYLLATILS